MSDLNRNSRATNLQVQPEFRARRCLRADKVVEGNGLCLRYCINAGGDSEEAPCSPAWPTASPLGFFFLRTFCQGAAKRVIMGRMEGGHKGEQSVE